ncbi:MAG: hypothetical protein KF850_36975 [Labilithrix sp.]|nr:hypothetical protein [Labilithrix sp.]
MSYRGGWIGLVFAAAACTGGASFSAGGSASGGAAGSPGSGPLPGAPPPAEAAAGVPMPVVACSLAGAGSDAGEELADADSPPLAEDSGTAPEDAGPDDPCATPPPGDCVSSTVMTVWTAGVCDGERCVFDSTSEVCPGGCFRQLDGGDRCLE